MMRYIVGQTTTPVTEQDGVKTGGEPTADLDELPPAARPYVLRYRPVGDGTYEVDVDVLAEVADLRARTDATEDEVRGIRERAAAAEVTTDDARKVRDAVAGPPD